MAARHSGYSWPAYLELARHERVSTVAFFRVSTLIDLHGADAVHLDSERRRTRARLQAGQAGR
jgi:hypothetical protein